MAVAHIEKNVTVGAIIGASGMESNDWQRAISKISRMVRDLEIKIEQTPLKVRLVYVVKETVGGEEEGSVKKKSYSVKDNYVLIEMVVPRPYGPESEEVLRELLMEGMKCAEEFARSKHIANDLHEIESVINEAISLLVVNTESGV